MESVNDLTPKVADDPMPSGNDSWAALRTWPAIGLLSLMMIAKGLPWLFSEPPQSVQVASLLGPAAAALFLIVWWLFASRAGRKEKAGGLFGLGVVAGLTFLLLHPTMRVLPAVVFFVPIGVAAFALPLVTLPRSPTRRVPCAILLSLVGFGFWGLLQFGGTSGMFAFEFDWRWNPSAEQRYLASLSERSGASADMILPDAKVGEPITTASAQWPGFRGANRDSVVRGVSISPDWKSSPPKELWRRLIGPGWSSFAVAGDNLFTQEQRGDDEAIVCLDATTGEPRWSRTHAARFYEGIGGAGPRATPTIGNGVLYTLGAEGQLAALDPSTGKEIWTRELREDTGRAPPIWGWSSSPLLIGDLVVVHAGGEGNRGLLAYNAATGAPAWSSPSGVDSYSSPHTATLCGVEGLLMITEAGIQFLNPSDGSQIWSFEQPGEGYRILQPLIIADRVLMGSSQGSGTYCLQVSRDSDQWQVELEWSSRDMKPDFNDFVVYQDHLYGFDSGILACVDLESGKRKWKRGRYGKGQLLLLADAGQLLIVSESGDLVLVQATPEKLDELASIDAIEGKTWNHPVLIENRVYVRNGAEAVCFELPVQ